MPKDFNNDAVGALARCMSYRERLPDESFDDYRKYIADIHAKFDFIESEEIRYGIGWDRWTKAQQKDTVKRKLGEVL